MYSVTGDTTSLVPGFPIRTSSDPRSVDSSPRHNAASHVLHRLPVPRHPPCALKHLQHKHKKILGRIRNCISDTKNTTPPNTRGSHPLHQMLATTIHKSNTTPHHQSRATTTNPKSYSGRHPTKGRQPISGFPPSGRRDSGPVVSKPNSVSGSSLTGIDHSIPYRLNVCRAPAKRPLQAPALNLPTALIPRTWGRGN